LCERDTFKFKHLNNIGSQPLTNVVQKTSMQHYAAQCLWNVGETFCDKCLS